MSLYVAGWAVTSCDMQQSYTNGVPVTYQILQATACSLMEGMSLCMFCAIPNVDPDQNFHLKKNKTVEHTIVKQQLGGRGRGKMSKSQ